MSRLIFDIETIGEDFDSLDKTSKEALTRWIKKESESEKEYEKELTDLKEGLGFSPFTGEIAAIGVLDYEKDKVVIYFQAPGENLKEFEEGGVKYKPMTEPEMLEKASPYIQMSEKIGKLITQIVEGGIQEVKVER